MSSIQPNPLYSRAEIGILPCSKCGKPMRLACIEPAQPGHEVRTFECPECKNDWKFCSRDLVATGQLLRPVGSGSGFKFADRSISYPQPNALRPLGSHMPFP